MRPGLMRIALILLLGQLTACSTNSYCLTEQNYQYAQVAPELKPVDELRLPTTGSSLRLPPAPEESQPFGVEAENGDGICLDKPPRLVIRPASGQTEAGSS